MRLGRLLWPMLGLSLTGLLVWQAGLLDSIATSVARSREKEPLPIDQTPRRVVAEGRVAAYPGAEVIVSTEVLGTIIDGPPREKAVIHKGDLIAELKADDLRASRAEAAAKMAEADADIRFYERELRRMDQLRARMAGSPAELDSNTRNLEAARARKAAATAARDHIDSLIAKTRILAPIDGAVIARHAQRGETLAPASKLVTLADLNRVRIEAEVDEFDTGKVVLGANVRITAEGYRDRAWAGVVEEIPDAVVGRRLRPEDPSRPTDTRILLVKIALNEPTPLRLGQRVEVEIAVPAAGIGEPAPGESQDRLTPEGP